MQFDNIYKDKSVFITGHTGFKGSWLSEWLIKLQAKVTGYSLEPPTIPSHFTLADIRSRLYRDLRGDVRDLDNLRKAIHSCKPDFIFHLAAQPIVRVSFKDPLNTVLTNFVGTLNILESLRTLENNCIAIMITTDKVYENKEWCYSYREADSLGGIDPYSASKACAETIISSYFRSFFLANLLKKTAPQIAVVSVRAGNVIGGGDWAVDRIVPDCIRSIEKNEKMPVRNRTSTRPWQHVLEPLSGYLLHGSRIFSEILLHNKPSKEKIELLCSSFNFGPQITSNRTVLELVQSITMNWFGKDGDEYWEDKSDPDAPHEAGRLNLTIDKAYHILNWKPKWNFERTVQETVSWYKNAIAHKYNGNAIREFTQNQIDVYSL